MIFDFEFQDEVWEFQQYVERYIAEKKTIKIHVQHPLLSVSQNKYFHLICSWYGIEFGFTTEEVKQMIKDFICHKIYKYEKGNITFTRSTSDLDSKEMTTVIDQFRAYSNDEAGFYIETPDDMKFVNHIRKAISKNNYV